MSRKHRMQRLGRKVEALVPIAETVAVRAKAEADELLREVTRAFAERLDEYRRGCGLGGEQPDPRAPPDKCTVEHAQTCPPEEVTFFDIERLTRVDPALAAARWREVCETARRDIESGFLAARALEPQGGDAWERACYAMMRERLIQAWQPRHAGELHLVEEIAQYEMLRRRWLKVLANQSHGPMATANRHGLLQRDQRQMNLAEQTEEAARMVERMQRLSMNALRTLQNLRRQRGAFIVGGQGPVNVAVGQQLNVNAPAPSETTK